MISSGGPKMGVTFSALPDQRCSPCQRGHLGAHRPRCYGDSWCLSGRGQCSWPWKVQDVALNVYAVTNEGLELNG